MVQKIDFDKQYDISNQQCAEITEICEMLKNKHEALSKEMFVLKQDNAQLQDKYIQVIFSHADFRPQFVIF